MYHCESEEPRKDRRRGCRGRVRSHREVEGVVWVAVAALRSHVTRALTDVRCTDADADAGTLAFGWTRSTISGSVGMLASRQRADQARSIDSAAEGINAALRNRARAFTRILRDS